MASSPTQHGNPTVISLSVQRIERVTQLRGSFERFAQPEIDKLTALVPEPECIPQPVDEGRLGIRIELEFEGHSLSSPEGEPSDETLIVRITSTYLVVYALDSDPKASDADLKAFSFVNGQFNVWPYWRQYVQDCLARIDLPVFVLPPLNPARMLDRIDSKSAE